MIQTMTGENIKEDEKRRTYPLDSQILVMIIDIMKLKLFKWNYFLIRITFLYCILSIELKSE